MYGGALLVVGLSVDSESSVTNYQILQTQLPTEIDFCGVVLFTDDIDAQLSPATLEILKVFKTKNTLLHGFITIMYS